LLFQDIDETTEYDEAELAFDTDYDRENPVTKHGAKRRLKLLKAKKKKQE
jgi:hypothetical protein